MIATNGTLEPFFKLLTWIVLFVLVTESTKYSQRLQAHSLQMWINIRAKTCLSVRGFHLVGHVLISSLPVLLAAGP